MAADIVYGLSFCTQICVSIDFNYIIFVKYLVNILKLYFEHSVYVYVYNTYVCIKKKCR